MPQSAGAAGAEIQQGHSAAGNRSLPTAADADRLSAGDFLACTRLVCGRELGAYFDSPIAYVYATVFLVLSCTIFMNSFFLDGVVDMSAYFSVLPFLLIPFIPAITMRSWAEERAQNTFELVMTLPLPCFAVILGKYLAAFTFYLLVLLGSLPIVAMLFYLGNPDAGLILAGYLGALLLGGFFLSFGLFASGLTRDQIVAFLLAALFGFVFVFTGHERVVEVVDGLWPAWQLGTWLSDSFSVLPRYQAFGRGVVELADLLYYALLSGFFIWLNRLTLHRGA